MVFTLLQIREAHRIGKKTEFEIYLKHGYTKIDFDAIDSVDMLKSYDNYHFLIALLNPLYEGKDDSEQANSQNEGSKQNKADEENKVGMPLTAV